MAVPVLLVTLSGSTFVFAIKQSSSTTSGVSQYLYLSSLFLLLSAIGVVWLLVQNRRKIEISMDLCQLACDILRANPSVFLLCLGMLLVHALFTLLWLGVFLSLFKVQFSQGFSWNLTSEKGPSMWIFLFFVFMYFWNSAVLQSIEKTTISGVVGDWYFNE